MFTSYCSRLHNVKTKRDKRTAKKSVKVQAVLEDDTSNNKPIHFGVYNNNKISLQTSNNTVKSLLIRLLKAVTKKRRMIESSSKILVLSSHATLKGTHSSPFATHNERLLYQ